MKNKIVYAPTVVFLGFIFILSALFVALPKDDYSSSEKRYLEKFPETNGETITNGKFESGFESYLADHFPFRNFWVGVNAYYNLSIGNNGNDGVYKCSDDYLINIPVSDDNRIEVNANTIAEFAKKIDVSVTVSVVPSTGYIMEDVLPKIHGEYKDDKLFETIANTLEPVKNVDFVDLREAFKKEVAKGTQIYYKTDHHWTSEGAYTGYKKIAQSLGVIPTDEDKFRIDSYNDFYGTTYSTSGFWLNGSDTVSVWNNKDNTEKNITVTITEGDEEDTYHSMFFLNHLQEDDKYPVFLDGNHPLVTIENNRVESGKLLIIKDSFCHTLAPFLADNFSAVTMVDLRYYKNSISNMVKDGGYDKVLVLYGIDNLAADSDLAWIN